MNRTRKSKKLKNVLGKPLVLCTNGTGYFRDGFCKTGPTNVGTHVVCSVVTDTFLQYSKSQDNDLISPQPGFPGLKPGDKWCLCAYRWKEAYDAGVAPPVILESTHQAVKNIVPLRILRKFAL
jgi:uncharacterized protein (DUF2237 family)